MDTKKDLHTLIASITWRQHHDKKLKRQNQLTLIVEKINPTAPEMMRFGCRFPTIKNPECPREWFTA